MDLTANDYVRSIAQQLGMGSSAPIDYAKLLSNDAYYQQALSMLNADRTSLTSQYQTDAQRAQNLYGEGPYSTLARLAQAHEDRWRRTSNNLVARGLGSSGEVRFQQGRENNLYGTQKFDAQTSLQNYLRGIESNYLTQGRALDWQQLGALQNAYTNQTSLAQILGSLGGTGTGTTSSAPAAPTTKQSLGYGTSEPWTAGW